VTDAWVSAFKIFIDVMTVAADAMGHLPFTNWVLVLHKICAAIFQFDMGRRPIVAMTAGTLLFSVRMSAVPGIKHIAFLH
jgi:hypothetical protein